MKVYFIFKIKEEYVSLYKDNSLVLFNILKAIYYLKKEEVGYGYNLFTSLSLSIDKEELDRDIFIKLHRKVPYLKRKDRHIYNDLYKDEVSTLIVKKSYIKLILEQDYSFFFSFLSNYSKNLFCCDFKNKEFFFIDEKVLV